jgi:hypothetical protein
VGDIVALVVIVVLVVLVVATVRGRRRTIVAKRGIGVGADLGGLADAPKYLVRDVRVVAPDRSEVVFVPEDGSDVDGSDVDGSDEGGSDDGGLGVLRFVVWLGRDDFGYDLLTGWRDATARVAMVLPPGSHLVRLRSVDTLQHLTLRRLEED